MKIEKVKNNKTKRKNNKLIIMLILLMIIIVFTVVLINKAKINTDEGSKKQIERINAEYETFIGKKDGAEVRTLLNKVKSYNSNIERDKQENQAIKVNGILFVDSAHIIKTIKDINTEKSYNVSIEYNDKTNQISNIIYKEIEE